MSLMDRIFDLVFPDRRRRPRRGKNRQEREDRPDSSVNKGYDDRYFIRRRP